MTLKTSNTSLLSELLSLYGPALTFDEAARLLKFNNIRTAYTARARGRFPVRTIDLGGKLGCSIVDIARFIETGEFQEAASNSYVAKRPGRPSKKEKMHRSLRSQS
ncbi:hypothetical protein [Methylovorus mays]|uniref:hypothetical protein n=1 Tax=Methylovorus mays TaxID=184077 RepID=UPI001E4DCCC6|nr:hypothetical protein [Methylovorus mays]MCB5206722.1 hypothetical protein [Methylovorus mays]